MFKAIGRGLKKAGKTLVGKGGGGERTFNNRGGGPAPTAGTLPRATFTEGGGPKGPDALPSYSKWAGNPAPTVGGVKANRPQPPAAGPGRLPNRMNPAAAAGPAKPAIAQKAKPVALAAEAGSFTGRLMRPNILHTERQAPAGKSAAAATPGRAAGAVTTRTIGQRISDRARARFYRSPSRGGR